MYVRKTTRRYKDKTYTNYLLVESVHTPNGPRQKVICSLGDLSPRPAEDWLRLARKVEDALVGQTQSLLKSRSRSRTDRPPGPSSPGSLVVPEPPTGP